MKSKFKKMMVLGLLLAVMITVKIMKADKHVLDIALCNIEALADSSEFNEDYHCVGSGSLDCPEADMKVYAIMTPYSLIINW